MSVTEHQPLGSGPATPLEKRLHADMVKRLPGERERLLAKFDALAASELAPNEYGPDGLTMDQVQEHLRELAELERELGARLRGGR